MCQRKVSTDVAHEIRLALDAPITLRQFKDAIAALPSGKAPGPSGLTANMIKAWPTDTIELVYDMLNTMWKDKSIPAWWGDKLLCGIPKKPGETALTNVRPIGLLEILRKLWTSMVVTRIQAIWEKHDILHPSQCGYRWRRGTSTAITQVVNAMEAARDNPQSNPLYCTFWDYKAAFDSIPRNLMRLAWSRLGVPDEHLAWLTSLDEEGLTFFLSPYMANRLDTRQPELLVHPDATDDHLLLQTDSAFTCERGVTQGDTMSTICWVAIFDMILSLIDPTGIGSDTAYADDLATLSPTPEIQQEKADLISAFCAFSGMAIAFHKVETICIQHPKSKNKPPSHLTLHTWDWDVENVPIRKAKLRDSTRYLGAKVAFGHRDRTSYKFCLSHLRSSLEALHVRRATQECRRKVIEMQLFPQILYHAIHAAWTLKQYERLDSILASALRRLHRLPRSYPTALIFLPRTDAGLGYRRFSDAAQMQKWGILQRNIALGGIPARTSHQLINRAITAPPTSTLYVTSLISWGKKNNLELSNISPGNDHIPQTASIDLLEKLRLNSDDDLVEAPVGAIFTDGSFVHSNLTPMTILEHPSRAFNQGTGGIAVIWLPPQDQIGQTPTRILRITPQSECIHHFSANTMELYGQVAAARFSTHVPPEVTSYSDCKAVVQSIQESFSLQRKPMGQHAKGIFYESIATSENLTRRPVKWTRSHPEDRIRDQSRWSYEEKGIFLADAVAENDWGAVFNLIGTDYIFDEVPCDDLLSDLLKPGIWHWRHTDLVNNPPALDELMSHVNYSAFRGYVMQRDAYRAEVGDPPRWSDINPNLAYSLCSPAPTSSYQAVKAASRIYRKSYRYGNNRAKGLQGQERAKALECAHCHSPETPTHIYAECEVGRLPQLRQRIHDSQTRALIPFSHSSIPAWQNNFFHNLHELSFSHEGDDAEKVWNGTLGRAEMLLCLEDPQLESLSLTSAQYQEFRKRFCAFVAPLTAAACEMELVKSQSRFASIRGSLRQALIGDNHVRGPRRRSSNGVPVTAPVLRLLNVTTSNPQRPPRSSPPLPSSDAPVLPFRRRHQLLLVSPTPHCPRSDPPFPQIMQLTKRADNLHLARTGHLRRGLPSHSQPSTEAPLPLGDPSHTLEYEIPPD